MSLSIRFLGTSASRPTTERNVAGIALVREGETMLFDCGEGTQRQMMRYGVSFSVNDIFFTHFHLDHILGAYGLLRTMQLLGRADAMSLWGPRGAKRFFASSEVFALEKFAFPVEVVEIEPGTAVMRDEYAIQSFAVSHRGAAAVGYALVEKERLGRFNPDRARDLGIPEGPLWGAIHRGQNVTLPDGRTIAPSELVGPTRAGRRVVITGDTRPCEATVEAAQNADLLIHEATFAEEEAARAVETGHSTAREAAEVAVKANARRLLLTHISSRYSWDASDIEREARAIFPAAAVARDGLEVDVPYPATVE